MELLKRGYSVRTTVRSLIREAELRSTVSKFVNIDDRLTVFAADLLADQGWSEAAGGIDYVIHVASPMGVGEYKNQDLVAPAREGTRRVLEAARRGGARHAVLTSSLEAAVPPKVRGSSAAIPTDEAVWTNVRARNVSNYRRAKTLAEQDAWALIKEGGHGAMTLTTILPSFIQGPVMGADYSGSVDLVARMLKGEIAAVPKLYFAIVDIRDLVDLHLKAMTHPRAVGERFIGTSDSLWMLQIAEVLREHLGERSLKLPTAEAPNLMIRLAAVSNPELRQITLGLGVRREFTSAKAERLLDWRPRPARNSITDAADSLLAKGLV